MHEILGKILKKEEINFENLGWKRRAHVGHVIGAVSLTAFLTKPCVFSIVDVPWPLSPTAF